MHKIEIANLSFAYGQGKPVLSGLSFTIGAKENVGIIGANGVGKSTLLKLMVGLLPGYSGELKMNQLPVEKQTLAAIRRQTGYVFQDSDSQMFLSTVFEDVAFAPRNYGCSEEEVKQRVDLALGLVHIEHLKDAQIYRLSGGEKKLAAMATILSTQPELLLLDEPSVALDPKNRRNLIHVLNELDVAKVIASHDLDLIWDTCERTILLAEGNIIRDGATRKMLSDRELLEANGLELPLSLSRR